MAPRQLDRTDPLPLWAQLEADLNDRLNSGEFDERFPTDAELTEQYSVSRHTVREAIRRLNTSGVLKRERGRGTVVDRSEFEQSLGGLYSLYQSVESAGTDQDSKVLDIGGVTDAVAASQLNLEADAKLFFLARVRCAGGVPLAIDRVWLPWEIGEPILDEDFSHTALYQKLEAAVGFRPTSGWERLSPVIPSAEDRRHLQIPKTKPAFFLERLGMHNGTPIEWRTTTIRGDRYRFVADWSPASQSTIRMDMADS